jgi:hypothetical protein
MKNFKFQISNFKFLILVTLGVITLICSSCFSMKYSFSGASIPTEMKTVYVAYFPNRAQVINPNLSQLFTEAMKEKFRSQTKLVVLNDVGDGNFEREIVSYSTAPMAITGNETAAKNRFTIAVRVKYTNALDPKSNFDQSFSRYEDYESNRSFNDVENELMKKIIDLIIEDVYNKAFVNW